MFSILLEVTVRSTLIAAVTAILLYLMRVRQAALCHRVWTGIMSVMFGLPLCVALVPQTKLPLLPPESWQSAVLTRTAEEGTTLSGLKNIQNQSNVLVSRKERERPWEAYFVGLYFAGCLVFLMRLGVGTMRVRRLLRDARLSDGRLTHRACISPITVGWPDAHVVLPEAWPGWPQGQLAAILAHEEEHVRRRDSLVQWFAQLNRAIFWFHPLAWWLERQISKLAEEACDEVVLSNGHEPLTYAEYLLSIARSATLAGTRFNTLGMAATGSGLPSRIKKLIDTGDFTPVSRSKFALITISSVAVVITFAMGTLAHAQPASPAFDVASIKPNKSGAQGGSSRFVGSSYIGENITLKRMIALAYSPIQEFEGGPGWIDSEHYDVAAKAEGTATQEGLQLMLRSLLADRFKLVVRKQTRERPAYALSLARSDGKLGPNLRLAASECSPGGAGKAKGKAPASGCFRLGNGSLTGRGGTTERLAAELNILGRLVVDRTGLKGIFDMDLQWTPDEEGTNADLFTAIREQLGLKLDATRAPVEVIVIDSTARPSEN